MDSMLDQLRRQRHGYFRYSLHGHWKKFSGRTSERKAFHDLSPDPFVESFVKRADGSFTTDSFVLLCGKRPVVGQILLAWAAYSVNVVWPISFFGVFRIFIV